MALIAGGPRLDGSKYILDRAALQNSMALAMEDEMKKLLLAVKGIELSQTGEADRLLLFTAIARGVLGYVDQNADDLIQTVQIGHTSGTSMGHSVSGLDLDIDVSTLPG